jgi:hypothetical protein
MTLDLHPDTVGEARYRGGDADPDRPEAIDEAINTDKLGYGKGEPLVGESYQDYPNRSELSNPVHGTFLRSLLQHSKVATLADAIAELTGANTTATLQKWLSTVEAAAEAHGLDVDTLLAEGDNEGGDVLEAVLGYEPPEAVVTSDNPLLVASLYNAGLSASEIATLLESKVEGSVSEGSVKDSLKETGLLDGRTRDAQVESFEKNDGRLGGTTMTTTETGNSNGLTVSAEDFA